MTDRPLVFDLRYATAHYPGIGSYMTDAVSKRDIPVILACGMVFGFVFILLNTIADVAAILLNPRLRRPR